MAAGKTQQEKITGEDTNLNSSTGKKQQENRKTQRGVTMERQQENSNMKIMQKSVTLIVCKAENNFVVRYGNLKSNNFCLKIQNIYITLCKNIAY